jgi:uncharacterized delta-60 repeat protein
MSGERGSPGGARVTGAVVGAILLLTVAAVPQAGAAAGELDPSFGTGGIMTTQFPGHDSAQANAVAVDSEGRIIAVGAASYDDVAVARYLPDGSLDSSFADDGRALVDVGGKASAEDVAVQPDDRVVIAGFCCRGPGRRGVVVRLTADGALDPEFAGDGIKVLPGTTKGHYLPTALTGVALSARGSIAVSGDSLHPRRPGALQNARSDPDFYVARLTPEGRMDRGFSGDGERWIEFSDRSRDGTAGVDIDPDGKIVVGGDTDPGGNHGYLAFARLRASGKLDRSFAGDGLRTLRTNALAYPGAVTTDSSGATLLVGTDRDRQTGADRSAVWKVKSNGKRALGFGHDGQKDLMRATQGTGVEIASDGRIVATASTSLYPYSQKTGLFRLSGSGNLDSSFSGDGRVLNTDFRAQDVTVQADGGILLAGFEQEEGGPNELDRYTFTVARYQG